MIHYICISKDAIYIEAVFRPPVHRDDYFLHSHKLCMLCVILFHEHLQIFLPPCLLFNDILQNENEYSDYSTLVIPVWPPKTI